MSNHLADIPGNNLTIYVPDTTDYQVLDPTLSADISPKLKIIKRPIWDPAHFYNKAVGEKNKIGVGMSSVKEKKSLIQKIGLWFRANVFVPDSRVFWVNPSYRFLKKYIEKNKIDVIVTTGPPHSMHLIGLKLKQYFKEKIIWVADFRDPWSEIQYYETLKTTKFAFNKIKKLEKKVLINSDIVTTVTPSWANMFRDISKRKIEIIENGYEDSLFEHIKIINQPKRFNIVHTGVMYATRNPHNLWNSLRIIKNEIPAFVDLAKIQLIGNLDASVINELKNLDLYDITEIYPPMSHKEVIEYQINAALLLLIIDQAKTYISTAKGMITGKIYEYFACQRPILGIGPTDGDAARILGDSEYAKMVDWDDLEGIKNFITNIYQKYINGDKLVVDYHQKELYSRKNLALKFNNILLEYINNKKNNG